MARLGLIADDGRPRVLPVTFAIYGDAIWSAIDDKPKRAPLRACATCAAIPPRRSASIATPTIGRSSPGSRSSARSRSCPRMPTARRSPPWPRSTSSTATIRRRAAARADPAARALGRRSRSGTRIGSDRDARRRPRWATTSAPLEGKRAAVMIGPLFEDVEATYPYYRLQEAGADVELIGAEAGASLTRQEGPGARDRQRRRGPLRRRSRHARDRGRLRARQAAHGRRRPGARARDGRAGQAARLHLPRRAGFRSRRGSSRAGA